MARYAGFAGLNVLMNMNGERKREGSEHLVVARQRVVDRNHVLADYPIFHHGQSNDNHAVIDGNTYDFRVIDGRRYRWNDYQNSWREDSVFWVITKGDVIPRRAPSMLRQHHVYAAPHAIGVAYINEVGQNLRRQGTAPSWKRCQMVESAK